MRPAIEPYRRDGSLHARMSIMRGVRKKWLKTLMLLADYLTLKCRKMAKIMNIDCIPDENSYRKYVFFLKKCIVNTLQLHGLLMICLQ